MDKRKETPEPLPCSSVLQGQVGERGGTDIHPKHKTVQYKCIPSPPAPCTGQHASSHLPAASPAPSVSCLVCGLSSVEQIVPWNIINANYCNTTPTQPCLQIKIMAWKVLCLYCTLCSYRNDKIVSAQLKLRTGLVEHVNASYFVGLSFKRRQQSGCPKHDSVILLSSSWHVPRWYFNWPLPSTYLSVRYPFHPTIWHNDAWPTVSYWPEQK